MMGSDGMFALAALLLHALGFLVLALAAGETPDPA